MRYADEKMLLRSSLLSLMNSIFTVINNNDMTNGTINNTYDELVHTASNQRDVLNSDTNQVTEYIINSFFKNESNTHNKLVLIVNVQPSVSSADLPNNVNI